MIERDVVIVGPGVFGSWTALTMVQASKSVLLIDAWGPGHSRSSSGGESRIIRMGYGADEIYTRMAVRSLTQWLELSEDSGESLFHRTGVLWIGRAGDPYSEATRSTLERVGVPGENLSAADLADRYPQMLTEDSHTFGMLEPQSGALMARRAISTLRQDLMRRGGEYATDAIRPPTGRGTLAS